MISYLKYSDIYAKSLELSYTFMKFGVLVFILALIFSFYLTDMVSKPIVTITESINRMLEDEESFKSGMLTRMALPVLGEVAISEINITEPTEVSNLRKAILGFRDALEKGSKNFDIEHSKLQLYIDQLYKELESNHGRNLEFISTLSHDIRTPLTLIKGYAMGLESGEIVDLDMRRKFQSGIVNSVDDIEKLVFNVLDFVYEINSMDTLKYEVYNIKDLIEELKFELEQLSKNNSRFIEFEIDNFIGDQTDYPLDLVNFKIVILNLINNSIKYTTKEDLIKLKISKSPIGVNFEVYDEGSGIREEDLDNIFAMYYRTDDSKNIKGYGLGLYISQEIVKAHGSKLKCESVYGQYTRMCFELKSV
ncbi:MAG: HAMP domain-containing sensor histidine kinase [Acidaminobacteraceae bacterium]